MVTVTFCALATEHSDNVALFSFQDAMSTWLPYPFDNIIIAHLKMQQFKGERKLTISEKTEKCFAFTVYTAKAKHFSIKYDISL